MYVDHVLIFVFCRWYGLTDTSESVSVRGQRAEDSLKQYVASLVHSVRGHSYFRRVHVFDTFVTM